MLASADKLAGLVNMANVMTRYVCNDTDGEETFKSSVLI